MHAWPKPPPRAGSTCWPATRCRVRRPTKTSHAAAAKANAEAAAADYARLTALESYKTLRAPFAGTITARNTDIGQLIKADSDSDPELFNLADTHQLRLYVPVPQNYAGVIRPALKPS